MRRHIAIAFGALVATAAVVVALTASGTTGGGRHRVLSTESRPPSAHSAPPATPSELAARINLAQGVIDDRSSRDGVLARAGRLEQLAILELEHQSARARRATLAALGAQASRTIRVGVDAELELSALGPPSRTPLPHWRIVQPPAPNTLLGYFRAAQAEFGVPWEDLAAIELIESDFGRVEGQSSAGAQGPMQFLPATWRRYGSGQVSNQRDAILAAARFLRASGAPGDMPLALYHYNNSTRYVRAVEDYARRMRADFRSYYGYYYWQVIYDRVGGPVVLPVGYPKARPQAIAFGGQG